MIKNQIFQQCLASIPMNERRQFEKSFNMAEHIDAILKEKGISLYDFAKMMGKSKVVIDGWLTGRHGFRVSTISKIENALNCKLV